MLRYLPHPLMVSVFAALMQFLQFQWPAFIAWTGFASWACCFIFVTTPSLRTVSKVILCWGVGVVAAIIVIELASLVFIAQLGLKAAIAFPVSLMFVGFGVICCENIKFLNFIPVCFIGAACFFGLHGNNPNDLSLLISEYMQLMLGCVMGQVFGYLTIVCRTYYENALKRQ